jgi:hypothetical protein
VLQLDFLLRTCLSHVLPSMEIKNVDAPVWSDIMEIKNVDVAVWFDMVFRTREPYQ